MTNFKIKHYEYLNGKGKVTNEHYYIQEWKKFLWWSYWKDIKHTTCGYSDCYKTSTTFETLEEAQQFIREVLCPEIPRDKSRIKEVEIITCKND
jgi:hypothetical protein